MRFAKSFLCNNQIIHPYNHVQITTTNLRFSVIITPFFLYFSGQHHLYDRISLSYDSLLVILNEIKMIVRYHKSYCVALGRRNKCDRDLRLVYAQCHGHHQEALAPNPNYVIFERMMAFFDASEIDADKIKK